MLSGIVGCDDKQVNINNKGDLNPQGKPYKRPSDRETKRGVSNDKSSIMVATDRNNNPVMRIAKTGRIDVDSIEDTMGELINLDNVPCSGSHPSIIKCARDKDMGHHAFIASSHIKDRCCHVQHVNSIDNLYERWTRPFHGVATKYLNGCLNWSVFLQKIKKSGSQVLDLAKVVARNVSAMNTYNSIEEKYINLNIPHYFKT